MLRRLCAPLLGGLALLGCSPVPVYNEDIRVKPADVVARVECELKYASMVPHPKLKLADYGAGFTLAFKVETEIGPNVKGDWIIPYHLTDTFTGGLTAGLTDNVVRDGSITSHVEIEKLKDYPCPPYLEQAYAQDFYNAEITYGSFGLIDWFAKMASTVPNNQYAEPNKMDYTVKFAVTGSAQASPGFKIVNLTGVVNLPAKRVDTHTLILAFLKKEKKDEPQAPEQVCVTNLPGATECKFLPEKKGGGVFMTPQRRAPPPRRGMSREMKQELNQQLDFLRLRDILRP